MKELTQEKLEEQSIEAIIVCLQNSETKLEHLEKESPYSDTWKEDSKNGKVFDLEKFYYRISNAKPWYRVGTTLDKKTVTADNEHQEKILENGNGFVKWITERIEYDHD